MQQPLVGKIALVTGSSSGIGEACASMLAAHGAKVIVHGRNEGRAAQVAAAIREAGGEATSVVANLASDEGARLVADAAAAAGGVDILVNNAGGEAAGGGNAAWLDVTSAEWLSTYDSNVLSAVRMIRHCVPRMRENGWGRIIQITSVVGHDPQAVIPDYGAAKAAMINLTVSLSKAIAGSGITSNSVSPGLITTPSVRRWLQGLSASHGWGSDWSDIEKAAVEKFVPNRIGRMGIPNDIAHAVCYLAHPLASFVTGTDLLISGGQ